MVEIELAGSMVKMAFLGGFFLASLLFILIAGLIFALRQGEMRTDMELMREELRDMERELEQQKDKS